MARRREVAAEDPAPVVSSLTAVEVKRLRELADLFGGDETAPLHVIEQVATIAGGPVEDFTGPHEQRMPLELWTWAYSSPAFTQFRAPLAGRLLAAVEVYRREPPPPWAGKHRPVGATKPRPGLTRDRGVNVTPA